MTGSRCAGKTWPRDAACFFSRTFRPLPPKRDHLRGHRHNRLHPVLLGGGGGLRDATDTGRLARQADVDGFIRGHGFDLVERDGERTGEGGLDPHGASLHRDDLPLHDRTIDKIDLVSSEPHHRRDH